MRPNRGQITVEALLIFGAFLLILASISIPNVFKAQDNARDVQFVADARYAADQLASIANSITSTYDKRTVSVYIPGYTSAGNVSGRPIIHMGTRICSPDGSNLVTTVLIVRRDSTTGNTTQADYYNFTIPLSGQSWTVEAPGGEPIFEDQGRWRNFTISWKNITSTTNNSLTGITCNQTTFPAGF
ncbi:MAG: hypothetical protein GXO65_05965 [Euryarchaeota archaeon]|nr:hypothetical protein [Euryarchaeota archaeon]